MTPVSNTILKQHLARRDKKSAHNIKFWPLWLLKGEPLCIQAYFQHGLLPDRNNQA